MLNFKDKLIELRKQNKITQDDLAKALKISRSAIGNYETGIREPNFETLEKIADYFNISMAELLNDNQASRLLMYYDRLKPLLETAMQLDAADRAKLEERAAMLLESDKYRKGE
jgi:transcriptional regulator with XRE-family HTH domain